LVVSVLSLAPEYNMDIQAHIPVALCAIHNFVQHLDPDVFFIPEFQVEHLERLQEDDGDVEVPGQLAEGPVDPAEWRRAEQHHDHIADLMWADYCEEARQRGIQL
jgi:hypothetical protein